MTAQTEDHLIVWQYDGTWTRVPGPHVWPDPDDGDMEAALARAGFRRALLLGLPDPEQVIVYEHKDDERWVIACCFDRSNVHSIYVRDLPSLIDVLAKISSIASAALSTPQPRTGG